MQGADHSKVMTLQVAASPDDVEAAMLDLRRKVATGQLPGVAPSAAMQPGPAAAAQSGSSSVQQAPSAAPQNQQSMPTPFAAAASLQQQQQQPHGSQSAAHVPAPQAQYSSPFAAAASSVPTEPESPAAARQAGAASQDPAQQPFSVAHMPLPPRRSTISKANRYDLLLGD